MNYTPLSLRNFRLDTMLSQIDLNKERIKNEINNYQCSDYLYEILLKTGQYINAKDIGYHMILISLLFKII